MKSCNKSVRRASEIQGTALGKCMAFMPAGVVQSRHAFVGGGGGGYSEHVGQMTDTRKQKATLIRNTDQVLTARGEHADRIVGSPSW